MNNQDQIDYNKKAIGHIVFVLEKRDSWEGKIIDVKNHEIFIVERLSDSKRFDVNIFDIRYKND